MKLPTLMSDGTESRAGRLSLRAMTDAGLTEAARAGSIGAFEELYRRHVPAARATARYLMRNGDDAEDVVADAFASVLNAFRNGAGPRDANFRAYLLACVRNGCVGRGRQRVRTVSIDPATFEDEHLAMEDPQRFVDGDAITKAYSALPTAWQRVLWMTEVEDRPLEDVADTLNLRRPAASALSRRARQGLVEAYLGQAVEHASARGGTCRRVAPQLARYVRGRCRPGQLPAVRLHVADCAACRALTDELRNVNQSLRGLAIPPIALAAFLAKRKGRDGAAAAGETVPTGTAATGTAATGTAATGTAATGIAATGIAATGTAAAGTAAAAAGGPVAAVSTFAKAVTATVTRPAGAIWLTTAKLAVVVGAGVIAIAPELDDESRRAAAVAGENAAAVVDSEPTIPSPDGATADANGVVPSAASVAGSPGLAPAADQGAATPAQTAWTLEVLVALAAGTGAFALDGALVDALPGLPGLTVPELTIPGAVPTVPSLPVTGLPTVTVPAVSVPPVSLPGLPPIVVPSVPAVTLPPGVVPPVTTTPVTVPPITVPPITLPPITVPPITLPPTTVPPITLPPTTIPPITLPPTTVPPITLPPTTLPLITVPPTTVPPITVPPITVPPITIPPFPPPIG